MSMDVGVVCCTVKTKKQTRREKTREGIQKKKNSDRAIVIFKSDLILLSVFRNSRVHSAYNIKWVTRDLPGIKATGA